MCNWHQTCAAAKSAESVGSWERELDQKRFYPEYVRRSDAGSTAHCVSWPLAALLLPNIGSSLAWSYPGSMWSRVVFYYFPWFSSMRRTELCEASSKTQSFFYPSKCRRIWDPYAKDDSVIGHQSKDRELWLVGYLGSYLPRHVPFLWVPLNVAPVVG